MIISYMHALFVQTLITAMEPSSLKMSAWNGIRSLCTSTCCSSTWIQQKTKCQPNKAQRHCSEFLASFYILSDLHLRIHLFMHFFYKKNLFSLGTHFWILWSVLIQLITSGIMEPFLQNCALWRRNYVTEQDSSLSTRKINHLKIVKEWWLRWTRSWESILIPEICSCPDVYPQTLLDKA